MTTSLLQAQRLIGLLDEHRRDFTSCSLAFERWCTNNIKPWFDDHVYWDTDLIRRWSGHDVDLTRPLPSDLIVAAAQADPDMLTVVGPYLAMLTRPAASAPSRPGPGRSTPAAGAHPYPPAPAGRNWPPSSPQRTASRPPDGCRARPARAWA